MSSSLVSGPYASAVSIKFTPSSTTRLRSFSAFCRSAGQPQMPWPVTRIAPKPRRFTVKSPPKLNVGFVAMFDVPAAAAPRSTSDLLARSAAPLARLIPRNLRRVTLNPSFESDVLPCICLEAYVHAYRCQRGVGDVSRHYVGFCEQHARAPLPRDQSELKIRVSRGARAFCPLWPACCRPASR